MVRLHADMELAFSIASSAALHERWNDSRFVWLPLQYALLPEGHDSQAELDALIARVSGVGFTEGNRVWYVVNEQFPLQFARTMHAAEKHHVLWIHDIRGWDDFDNPDEMSFRYALGTYLAALTRRVRHYDRTGSFPVYIRCAADVHSSSRRHPRTHPRNACTSWRVCTTCSPTFSWPRRYCATTSKRAVAC
jgi:hypothetical protein